MKERTDLTPAQAKKQARQKAYYQAHREEIRQQQREYYQRGDKAVHAAKVREYRRKNHETYLAYRREYRARNQERFAEYNRRSQEKRGKQRAAATVQKDSRSYYERNRYELCRRRIGEECFRAMEKVKAVCPERIERYLEQWPFEAYAAKRIKSQLWQWRIYPQHRLYDDCYDAGMLAYLYSVYRCAMMEYQHVNQYIAKMVRIFIICALNAGHETENLCRENNLRLYHIDHDVFDD